MERKLESISIKYWNTPSGDEYQYSPYVILFYRVLIDNIPQKIDTVILTKDQNFSSYDEKIQKICQIAFEEL
jgi:hypothetical protein